jgi:hypothetical protein
MGLVPLISGCPAELVTYQVFVYGKVDGRTYRLFSEAASGTVRAGLLVCTAAADAHQLT